MPLQRPRSRLVIGPVAGEGSTCAPITQYPESDDHGFTVEPAECGEHLDDILECDSWAQLDELPAEIRRAYALPAATLRGERLRTRALRMAIAAQRGSGSNDAPIALSNSRQALVSLAPALSPVVPETIESVLCFAGRFLDLQMLHLRTGRLDS